MLVFIKLPQHSWHFSNAQICSGFALMLIQHFLCVFKIHGRHMFWSMAYFKSENNFFLLHWPSFIVLGWNHRPEIEGHDSGSPFIRPLQVHIFQKLLTSRQVDGSHTIIQKTKSKIQQFSISFFKAVLLILFSNPDEGRIWPSSRVVLSEKRFTAWARQTSHYISAKEQSSGSFQQVLC